MNEPHPLPGSRRLPFAALAAIFAVALLLRLAAVWPDPSPGAIEARSVEWARETPGGADGLASVLHWLGPNETGEPLRSYRLAFAALGALACALLALAGSSGGGALAGWAAGALLAVGGVALERSVTVGPAAMLQLAGAGAFAGLLGYASTGRWLAALLFGASVGLGASVDGAVAVLLLAFPLASRLAAERAHGIRDGAIALTVATIVFALAAPDAFAARELPRLVFDDAPRVVSPLWTGLGTLASAVGWLPAVLVAFVVVTSGGKTPARLVAACVAAWLLVTLLRNGLKSAAVLGLLPGAVLLAGLGFARATSSFATHSRRTAWAALAILVLVTGIGGGRAIAGRWAPAPRDLAAGFLRTNLSSGGAFWTDDAVLADAVSTGGAPEDATLPATSAASSDRALQPFVAPPVATNPPESTIFYDPNLALFFPYVVLRDLEDPRLAKDVRDRSLHGEFQEVFRSQWETRARFDSKRPGEPGITILARPKAFEMDRESHRDLFRELADPELTAVRDTSSAFTDWLVAGGTILRSVGELAGADGYLRAAESRDDGRADVHFQLGLVASLLEHWDAAKTSLLRALAIDETLGEAHYNLGAVFEQEGDLAGAESSYRAAILFSKDSLNAHARLGALLARQGDVEGAIEELRTIREIDPNSDAFRHLSAVLTDT